VVRIAIAVCCASPGFAPAQTYDGTFEGLLKTFPAADKFVSSSLVVEYFFWYPGQMRIVPASAPVNVPRIISMVVTSPPSCRGDFAGAAISIDFSTLINGVINIGTRAATPYYTCPGTPTLIGSSIYPITRYYYEITPTVAGAVNVRYADPLGSVIEATMITTALGTATPRYDINGMWYDPASDGSGISMHQAANNGSATLGTWFMFDRGGATRWYSLQASSWVAADTLQGTFIEATASCAVGMACPAKARLLIPTFNFRMVFQSAASATAEVFGEEGKLLFKSELRRLQL